MEAHVFQKVTRRAWIQEGKLRGMQHVAYQAYKSAKRVFGKLLRSKHIECEQEV